MYAQRGGEVQGNGKVTEVDRNDLTGFSGATACCSMLLTITKGDNYAVKVITDENLQEFITTEIVNGVLRVGKNDRYGLYPTERTKIYVTMPAIDYLKSSSSSDILCQGSFRGDELKLDVSSSGSIELDYQGSRVEVDGSSSGEVKLKGRAEKLSFDGSSSSRLDARKFTVADLRVDGSSMARVRVGEVNNGLEVDLSSGSKVEYGGKAKIVSSDLSSGGKVKKINW